MTFNRKSLVIQICQIVLRQSPNASRGIKKKKPLYEKRFQRKIDRARLLLQLSEIRSARNSEQVSEISENLRMYSGLF